MGTGKEIIYSRVCLLILSCNSEVQENNKRYTKSKTHTKKTHTVLGTVRWFVLLVFFGGGGDGGAFCFFFLPQWF